MGAIGLADADLQRFLLPPLTSNHYFSGGGGSPTGGTVTVTEVTGVDTVTGVGGIAGAAGSVGTTWVTELVVDDTVETTPSGAAAAGALPETPLAEVPLPEVPLPEELLSDGRSLVGAVWSAPCLETAERRWRKAATLTARARTPEEGGLNEIPTCGRTCSCIRGEPAAC